MSEIITVEYGLTYTSNQLTPRSSFELRWLFDVKLNNFTN